MYIFIKFFCVGALNTALDFFVLNFCIFIFGTGVSGELFVAFKSLSFLAAVTMSYMLNKRWVFEHKSKVGVREPVLFFTVSAVGFFVNVAISFWVFKWSTLTLPAHLAANVGALAGTFAVFLWNFAGYRFVVFKKHYG